MAEALRPLIGWPLLPVPDDHGQLPFPNLETSVRESIRVILSTRPGEQLMRPDFGAGLDRLLHEPNTLATRRSIRDLVQDSLDALGAPHPARSRGGLGSLERALTRLGGNCVPAGADRCPGNDAPHRAARRLRNRACPFFHLAWMTAASTTSSKT